ncbi:hypothetical protein D3P09_16660 [Paenibacillus pinisoli]|uniref:Pre-toxin TG domain-containing protein n=1 Tax=Paenibacillus pinisoli TaxID=1276110 RepID=A0A3A6PTQ1_9BACL|nr:pre-toxin TG domain-containing protein [Paenibacillus pinisoli]RJX39123.1 hypothetical protein D3P09_16660 [Paenibacillus pinisoli]
MSQIKIDTGRVQSQDAILNTQAMRLTTAKSGVNFISVDGSIAARRSISSRISRARSDLQEIDRRFRDIQLFIKNATEQYNKVENELIRKSSDTGVWMGSFPLRAGSPGSGEWTPEQLAALALMGQGLMFGLEWLIQWQQQLKERQASAPPPTTISPDVSVKYYEFNYDVNDYVVYTSDGKQTKISFSNLENLLYQYNAGKMVEMWPSDVFEQVRGFDGKKIQEFLDYAISQGYDPVTFEYKGKKMQDNPDAHSYVEKRQQYYEDNKEGPKWFLNGVSFGLDFVPVAGNIKAGWEAISGKNAITGEDLSTADRWMAAAGVVLPWVRKAGKLVGVAKHGDEVVDAVKGGTKKVGPGAAKDRPVEGTGEGLARSTGQSTGSIDPVKFDRMKKAFEKQGGVIDQSDEAIRYLDYRGAEAVTWNEKTIQLRQNPTTSAVFEEFIHTAQYRAGKIPDQTPRTVLTVEIEAAEKLINYRKAYGIPNDETRATIERLRRMRQELDELGK